MPVADPRPTGRSAALALTGLLCCCGAAAADLPPAVAAAVSSCGGAGATADKRLAGLAAAGWRTAADTPEARAGLAILAMFRFPRNLSAPAEADAEALRGAIATPAPQVLPAGQAVGLADVEAVAGTPAFPFRAALAADDLSAVLVLRAPLRDGAGAIECEVLLAEPPDPVALAALAATLGLTGPLDGASGITGLSTAFFDGTDAQFPLRRVRLDVLSPDAPFHRTVQHGGSPWPVAARILAQSGPIAPR
ncbi:MAG TPA: hypothetical protein PKD10_12990 [Paracoccaceae bacterium]|nr:hypothetical protein [Paracoccaceae bacterium]HMO72714.1 hypothetical protein [Paracoccaceae bacterium]